MTRHIDGSSNDDSWNDHDHFDNATTMMKSNTVLHGQAAENENNNDDDNKFDCVHRFLDRSVVDIV